MLLIYKKLSVTTILFVLSFPVLATDVFKVVRVVRGDSLNLRAYPSPKSRIKVAIPHNASWIVKGKKEKVVGGSVWSQVVWNKQEGWVNSRFLSLDPVSTRIAKHRQQCIVNPKVTNKACCGYPASQRNRPFRAIDIYSIKAVADGKTTSLRTHPGKWKGKLIVAIPHNAKWISRLGQNRKLPNGDTWQYVRWNGQNGWVNSAHIVFDQVLTQLGNSKRKRCSVR